MRLLGCSWMVSRVLLCSCWNILSHCYHVSSISAKATLWFIRFCLCSFVPLKQNRCKRWRHSQIHVHLKKQKTKKQSALNDRKKNSILLTVSDIWTSLYKLHYNYLIGTLFSRYQFHYQPLKISYWLTTNLITNCLLRNNKKTESSTILSADHEHTDTGPLSPRQTLFWKDYVITTESKRLTLLDNKRPNSCLAPQITRWFRHLLCTTDVK